MGLDLELELRILYAIQGMHTDLMDLLMVTISTIGDKGMVWIAMAAALMFSRKTRRCGILMLVSMFLCLLFGNGLLKNLIARERPCWIDPSVPLLIANPWDYSFPSGHTMHAFTAAVVIFLHNRRAGLLVIAMAAVMAFSRMYLFVHFPTDILGGAIVGILAAMLVCRIFIPRLTPEGIPVRDKTKDY